jgi:hypothetical protein
MAMPIERKNSFHLLLSDDELKLLKLLAENEGLNASDFLRMLIRRRTDPPREQLMQVLSRSMASLSLAAGEHPSYGRAFDALREAAAVSKKKR